VKYEELFDKFLQRSLTRDEVAQLKKLLREDPAAGRALVEHIHEASLMVRVGTQLSPAQTAEIVTLPNLPAPTPAPSSVSPTPASRTGGRGKWRWAAMAATLLLLAVTARVLRPQSVPLHALLSHVSGEVSILRGDKTLPAETGLRLQQGDIVQTAPRARAVVVFEGEASRVEVQTDSRVHLSSTRQARRIQLLQGALEASVSAPPGGQAMVCETLHAEARARATRFLLASEVSSTRLEVTEGAVEFVRHTDGQSLVIRQGWTAIASPNVEFAVRPFLPEPWKSQDIGAVGLHGQGRFDGRTFRLRGAGQDTCSTKDQFHFTHQPLEGDGEIVACVRDIEFTDPEAKAMLMIRQQLRTASPQVSLGMTAAGRLEVEHRARTESRIRPAGHASTPCWLRLVRQGDVITSYYSLNGTDWVSAGASTNPMPARVFIGLGVTSYNHAALSTAVFDEVRITSSSTMASLR